MFRDSPADLIVADAARAMLARIANVSAGAAIVEVVGRIQRIASEQMPPLGAGGIVGVILAGAARAVLAGGAVDGRRSARPADAMVAGCAGVSVVAAGVVRFVRNDQRPCSGCRHLLALPLIGAGDRRADAVAVRAVIRGRAKVVVGAAVPVLRRIRNRSANRRKACANPEVGPAGQTCRKSRIVRIGLIFDQRFAKFVAEFRSPCRSREIAPDAR